MQIHIYGHVCLNTHFCKANFCGTPSSVFDKLGCAAGGKGLQNTDLEANLEILGISRTVCTMRIKA